MLTHEQLDALRDVAGELIGPINDYLLSEIARRISEAGQLTSTATYEIWRMQNLGVSQREIKKRLRALLQVSHRELRRLLTQAADVGYSFDLKNLPFVQAVPFEANGSLQQMLRAAVTLAQEDLTNLVQTIGFVAPDGKTYPLTKAYKKACDFAFTQTFTGATDYNTAIRQACRNLASQGIRTIDYESGIHTSLEAAVRRNVMGGLGLMQEQISQENHDTLGADGWEISAHAASAPDHEGIQGRQYSDAEYTKLNASLHRRIGTLNCGHDAFPIFLGANEPQYNQKELAEFKRQNAEGVSFEGRHYTVYEATQKQRQVERAIRSQKNRILVSEATGDKEKLLTDQIRLRRLNEEYSRFSQATGLRTQTERAQVTGFGRGQAARAAAASQKPREPQLKNAAGQSIIIVSHATTVASPNSATQRVGAKGGVDRNFYGGNGKQVIQISNHGHGHKKEEVMGQHGEHAHDYFWGEDGRITRGEARELTEQERRDNGDFI